MIDMRLSGRDDGPGPGTDSGPRFGAKTPPHAGDHLRSQDHLFSSINCYHGRETVKTRKDYEVAVEVVTNVINGWNPYCLLEDGAPTDEFGPEIRQLVTYIPGIRTRDDAARAVSEVFSKMFEPDLFAPESCGDVGARLYEELDRSGLLTKEVG